ncbi:RNA polymerase sigma factor [Actinoplanes sp. CA-030573]|uniref:RNA polymerase sigma factor n=1 Tax=Actinoplanes sp. CA-030573 TaxID=3239898 RepID=UPI003D9383E1
MIDVRPILDAAWRAHAAGVLGVLARRLGDLDRAEEALQDAMADALRRWPAEGVPENVPGWLVTAAWHRALDRLRREATGREKLAVLAATPPAEPTGDDRLALLFACCHPSLEEPAQMALTLHAMAGLPADKIAAAFLLPRSTMAQRLVRAKRRLRGVGFEVGDPLTRLPAVLAVIYLIYNEGHLDESRVLAHEALDLARQLAALLPDAPEAAGLAALVELHESRAAARLDAHGHLVLLEHQDRTRWDRSLIRGALARLARAAAQNRPGPYQLEAAIAALHALAPSYPDTDWPAVRRRYDDLLVLCPSPVVLLGRAVATGFVDGPAAALAEVDALADRLAGYRLWHATRADLLARLNRTAEAREATRRALALATNAAERELLARRLAGLSVP